MILNYPRITIFNDIIEADMPHYNYTLIKDENNRYKSFMKIYIEINNYHHRGEITSYLKCCNYQYIHFFKKCGVLQSIFTVDLGKHLMEENVEEMIEDIYEDFMYVINFLNNEKKILRHYPSLINRHYEIMMREN